MTRAWQRVVLTVAVALLTALLWGWDARLRRGELDVPAADSDHVNIAVYLSKKQDPGLYPRDYLFADPRAADHYTPSWLFLLGSLAARTGSWMDAVVLLVPALTFLLVVASAAFLSRFTSRFWLAVLVAALSTIPHHTIGGYWGAGGLDAALPRTLFAAAAAGILLLWLERADRLSGAAIALGLTGLAANLHPVSGAGLAQILLLDRLVACLRGRFRWIGLPAIGGAFLVGALPFVLGFFGGGAGRPAADVTPAAFYEAVVHRFPHDLLPPNAFRLSRFLESTLPLLPLLSLALLPRRGAERTRDRRGFALRMLAMTAVVGLGGTLVLMALARWTGWWLMTIDQLRNVRFVWPFLFALVVAGLDRLLSRSPRWVVAPALLASVALLVPVVRLPALALTKENLPTPVRFASWILKGQTERLEAFEGRAPDARSLSLRAAARWVRRNTPREALCLCEDGRFRLWSGRSAAFAYKDGGTAYYLGKGTFLEWYRRALAVERVTAAGTPEAWTALARELGCDYLVVEDRGALREPFEEGVVFADEHVIVVRVDG